jgi:PAS domain S-box
VQSAQEQRAGQNVSTVAGQIGREIRNDIAAYGTTLRGLHGLFINSRDAGHDDFQRYVELLHLQHDAARLQRFGFVERQGNASILKYVEPLAGNEVLLGRDLAEHPAARDAIERAMASGSLTLSAPFRMTRTAAGDTGLILVLPLYASDNPARPYAATGRRVTALVGLTINLERTLHDIAGPLAQRHVYLKFTELERAWDSVAANAQPFFDSAGGAKIDVPAWLTASRELEVLGNRWRLDIIAEPASMPPATRYAPQLTLALALTLTLLLFLLVRTFGRVGTLATGLAEKATAELRQSEAMFRDLAELSSDWFWEQDANFRYTAMSGGMVNKGNFLVEATLGRTRWELPIVGVSEEAWARHRAQLERHEPFRDFVYQIRAADGLLHWYAANGNPVFDAEGRFAGYRGTGHDITRSRQAEQALHDSEARLALALEAAGAGLWDFDPLARTTYFSPRFGELLGYPDAQSLKEGFFLREALHPEDRERVLAVQERALLEGARFDETYRLRRRDGGFRWFRGIGQAYLDEMRQAIRYPGLIIDVTAQREAEQALRRFNAELERRVAERTAALTASNKELEAFSYSVSHDLRAPLRAIDGFSRIVAEDYADRLDGAAQDHLARIRAASQRMATVIDDMLELARIARIEPERRDVDLSALAAAVCGELPEEPRRVIELAIAPGVHAQADPRLMHIVLQNLLHNAWKFTGRSAAARIEFGEIAVEGERVFFVRDNGAGFDPAHAKNLFGAFQRLHRPDEFAGTGIGLATAQRIVQRHGGRIWAEGAVGRGAVFYFTLG